MHEKSGPPALSGAYPDVHFGMAASAGLVDGHGDLSSSTPYESAETVTARQRIYLAPSYSSRVTVGIL